MEKREYDFTTLVDRRKTGASKWVQMLKESGEIPEGLAPLSVADMEFVTAPEIREFLKEVLDTDIMGYTGPNEAYTQAVTSWMRRRHNWEIRPEWICPSSGVVPALNAAVEALCKPGEGVILMPPIYPPFYEAAKRNGCHSAPCPLIREGEHYRIDFQLLEQVAADPANTLLLFCSPHNPIGRVWSLEELKQVAEICRKNGVFVVADEIHFDLIQPEYTHTVFLNAAPEMEQTCMVCTAPSKSFNLAGLATSNLVIPNPQVREAIRSHLPAQPNFMGYRACQGAYERAEGWLDACIRQIGENAAYVTDYLREKLPWVRVFPLQGTYLLWADFNASGLSGEELERRMKKQYLYLDEGYIFGKEGEGFERINLACPRSVLENAMERMVQALGDIVC